MSAPRMHTDLQPISVRATASLVQVMAVISDGRLGIALVVDERGRLLGTITDGDVRRAILKHTGLDETAGSIMIESFSSVAPGTSVEAILELMHRKMIRQVPVCSEDGHLIGLYVLEDFTAPSHRPNWAVIAAGGRGRRLWPLTAFVPKPMLPIGDRPMLERLVKQLVQHGFVRIFISVNYLEEQIIRHFGDGTQLGCSIEYLRESEPLGTGGALGLLPQVPQHPVLVTNADLHTDVDFSSLMDFHEGRVCAMTVCVQEAEYHVPYGVVRFAGGDEVTAIDEKPVLQAHINLGIYVMDPEVILLVPPGLPTALPDLVASARERGMTVDAYRVTEEWMDVGHLSDYRTMQGGSAASQEPATEET